MRSDDEESRREAKENRELREAIQRSIEREDEREPTPEAIEEWGNGAKKEEPRDAPQSAQAPAEPPRFSLQATAGSPSGDSSRNGKRRGGPSSAEGKARSKNNATTHGILSSVIVLRNESREDYDALLNGLGEYFRPEGSLETLLVEKLAMLIWRYRRLLLAEGDEIVGAVDHRPLRLVVLENVGLPKRKKADEGLFWGITDVRQLQECLDLLTKLRDGIQDDGLRPDRDRPILEEIYGFSYGSEGETLSERYEFWSDRAYRPDGEPKLPAPILSEIDDEIARLTSILEEHEVRHDWDRKNRKIVVRRPRHIPDSPAAERLLRYEASLERAFERTLAQLERMQRIRKGQPVAPRLEVGFSV